MSESIEIAGIEIPKADWEATPASVRALVKLLSERLAHIEEQLNQNSSNSSRPPSSNKLKVTLFAYFCGRTPPEAGYGHAI